MSAPNRSVGPGKLVAGATGLVIVPLQVSRRGGVRRCGTRPLGGDDVRVVAEPVQQRRGQLLVGEHADPLAEGQIGGHDRRASFIAIRDQVEQQLAAGTIERDESELVDLC